MQLFIHHSSQTLTTLDLGRNQIDAQGAEHLANALQQNEVRLLTALDFLCIYSFIYFYRHSQHWICGATKSVLKAQNILRMRWGRTWWDCSHHSTTYASIHSSFSTDTHNSSPRVEPNRRSRRKTSCECVAAKQGKIAHSTRLPMHLSIHLSPQTLTTLNLEMNEISTQGAEHLANALQQNVVRLLVPLDSYASISQTLTTLDLGGNEIGAQGAKHLANALQQNMVRVRTPLNFLCIYSFIFFNRRSQHLASEATKSVLKAQNILRMRCGNTR